MDQPRPEPGPETKTPVKPQVIRGARACTVCRAAKMKCVGAEDGQKPCQRCKRAGVECIFEKHRRGRKPGSKLSEASKMLRRLEKGLNNAKLKSQSTEAALSSSYSAAEGHAGSSQDPRYMIRSGEHYPQNNHLPSKELPSLSLYQNGDDYSLSNPNSRTMDVDDEDEDHNHEGLFPAKLIRKEENQRNSFFRTILNPEETPTSSGPSRGSHFLPPPPRSAIPSGPSDPISSGIMKEDDAKLLFDLIFLRLNPFINLFDPALHSVTYVRSKCPFLFTTLLMAGCKFFKAEAFKACQKLANDLAVRAFAEGWKSVEVVQAFACLTYWKEPDDNRTWTYIGYACRMAVELGLNRHVAHPPLHETEFQRLERRNRERTYLVLWVHDRSLSTQTGRHWMLPEDDLIRHSTTWHEEGGGPPRPEDVIVAAMVQLRRIASETTDMFYTSKVSGPVNHHDVNYDVVLRSCNGKLTQWMDTWQREMQRAGGESFHFSFLSLFRLGVRLFLNSFGIQASMSPSSRASPSLHPLNACYTSAKDSLKILSNDFASINVLRYGQDSITVLSAYSAVFLLKLLRSSSTFAQLNEGTAEDIHVLITKTADAYRDASMLSPASTSAAYHARFLRSLATHDEIFKTPRRHEKDRTEGVQIDPRLEGVHSSVQASQPQQMYSQQATQSNDQSFHFPASPHLPAHPTSHNEYHMEVPIRNGAHSCGTSALYQGQNFVPTAPHHASELDAHYWKNMFLELGFGGDVSTSPVGHGAGVDARSVSQYCETPLHHPPSAQQGHQLPYHLHPPSHQGYGH